MHYMPPETFFNDNSRRRYPISGVVEGHVVRQIGWWIFKYNVPTLIIRINEQQRQTFNKEHGFITQVIRLGIASEQFQEYPIGSAINIIFGCASPFDQRFCHVEAIKVMDIKRSA